MIKAIFIDFDGTLFSHTKHAIPASSIQAINIVRSKGIKVYLCTGRAKVEFKQFDLSELNVDGMVLCNGQIVLDNEDNIIYENEIKGVLKDKLVKLFNDNVLSIYFTSNDEVFLNYANELIKKIQANLSSGVPDVRPYNNQKIYMASAFFDNEEERLLINELGDEAQITSWHIGAVDIVPKGSCKANGIMETIKKLNISIDEVMGIGDGDNDIDMLEKCGVGVAMGNSIQSIKDIADYITDDIDEDGLYKAFKHYGLI